MAKYKLLRSKKTEGIHYLITLEKQPTFLEKLFGRSPVEETYKGSVSVWHKLPEEKRCPTSLESVLCRYYETIKANES